MLLHYLLNRRLFGWKIIECGWEARLQDRLTHGYSEIGAIEIWNAAYAACDKFLSED